MSEFFPKNEQEAREFEARRKLENERENLMEDAKKLKADPLQLFKLGGFDKEKAGANFEKIIKAFNIVKDIPKKGLVIIGSVGTGKTLAIRSLFPSISFFRLADVCELQTLEPKKEDDGSIAWSLPYGSLIFDDIGNEPIKNNFGIKADIVGDYILQWHTVKFEDAKDQGRLFATTNLDMNQLHDRYGERVLDRIIDMCVIVKFEGKSRRNKPIIIE